MMITITRKKLCFSPNHFSLVAGYLYLDVYADKTKVRNPLQTITPYIKHGAVV